MNYPELENLENSKRIGANLYDIFKNDISEAAQEFEQAGLKITQIVEHKKKEPNYIHTFYFITVEWINC